VQDWFITVSGFSKTSIRPLGKFDGSRLPTLPTLPTLPKKRVFYVGNLAITHTEMVAQDVLEGIIEYPTVAVKLYVANGDGTADAGRTHPS
jgi:hypothetical protein